MPSSESTALATRWCRTVRGFEGGITTAYLRSEMGKYPASQVAEALELVCDAAERAHDGARELLVALTDLLAAGALGPLVDELKQAASSAPLASLARLLRCPITPSSPPRMAVDARVPDYTGGRPLSLGERKALARRPTRASLAKLLADPHPAVIRALLDNPKVVEDDVVRLAAKRPALPEVLAQIARATRWAHRVRVRMAIVLNPDTPALLAAPLLALLTRPELRKVLEVADLSDALRSAARDLLARKRRGPAREGGDPS